MGDLSNYDLRNGTETLIEESRTATFDVHTVLHRRMSEDDVVWVEKALPRVVNDIKDQIRTDHPGILDDEVNRLLTTELAHPLFEEKINDFLVILQQKERWMDVKKTICALMINAKARISSINELQLESLLDDLPAVSEELEKLTSENARHLLMHRICLGLLSTAADQSSIAALMDEGDLIKKSSSSKLTLQQSFLIKHLIDRTTWRIVAAMFHEDTE